MTFFNENIIYFKWGQRGNCFSRMGTAVFALTISGQCSHFIIPENRWYKMG